MRIGFWKLCGGTLALLLALYLLNPLGTSSSDLRLRLLGIAPFTQASQSMAPALQAGDIILASAWPYVTGEPERGDIVVFLAPQAEGAMFVKRLIGLPGEQVELRGGQLFIDGERLEEPYLHPADTDSFRGPEAFQLSLGADQYFMLGDYRDNSNDSRYWGPVSRKAFAGKVGKVWRR